MKSNLKFTLYSDRIRNFVQDPDPESGLEKIISDPDPGNPYPE
jgi:hypothetical protein